MLLHTHVYLTDADHHEFLPADTSNDKLIPATIKVDSVDFAYPLDEEHTQVMIGDGVIKLKTSYDIVQKAMIALDED